jgi:hypothetical protein
VAGGAYIFRQVLANVLSDPDREKHEQARLRAEAHLERLQQGRNRNKALRGDVSDDSTSKKGFIIQDLNLNEYENIIALDLVSPDDISVGFNGELYKIRPGNVNVD